MYRTDLSIIGLAVALRLQEAWQCVLQECGLEQDEQAYVDGFTTVLMVPFLKWARGATFREVSDGTMVFEGTLIRCARRLMELMNQVIVAAQQIGDQKMEEQIQQALDSMQRGIMFCGSLYLA